MATNVYRSEQRVSYNAPPTPPTSYFGWEYSFSGGEGDSLHVFNSEAARDRFVAKVGQAIGDAEIKGGADVEEVAALYAFGRYGDGANVPHVRYVMLLERLSEGALSLLEDAFEGFDITDVEEETAGHA
jgi:hypothetical protein